MHHVLGIIGTKHSHSETVERTLQVASELLERAAITFASAVEEQSARFIGTRRHQRTFARRQLLE